MSYSLSWTIEDPESGEKKIYDVEYSVSGRFTRGSREDPPEFPEVEIDAIYDPSGNKIPRQLWAQHGFTDDELVAVVDHIFDNPKYYLSAPEPEYEPDESMDENKKRDNLLSMLCENVSAYDMRDAYSYERIGYEIGDAILKAAVEHGLSDSEAEWLFRSKHSRWFMDEFGPKIASQARRLFDQYLKTNRNKVMRDIESLRREAKSKV